MSVILRIHGENPQTRLIDQAVKILEKGGVALYPTDSTYALGCLMGNKKALDAIRLLRQLSEKHQFTILCKDLSDIAQYAKVDNQTYRFLKAHTPGPFTFLLQASRSVPDRLMHPKKKTIGIRVPQHPILCEMLRKFDQPLINTSCRMPDDDWPLSDPVDIESLANRVDVVIESGFGGLEGTTVLDCINGYPEVVKQGIGELSI